MVNHHMMLAGLVTLIGVAAYETNGFGSFGPTNNFLGSPVQSGSLASTGALSSPFGSPSHLTHSYDGSLTGEMKKEVSDMTTYIEGQLKLLAETVQGSSAHNSRSKKYSRP